MADSASGSAVAVAAANAAGETRSAEGTPSPPRFVGSRSCSSCVSESPRRAADGAAKKSTKAGGGPKRTASPAAAAATAAAVAGAAAAAAVAAAAAATAAVGDTAAGPLAGAGRGGAQMAATHQAEIPSKAAKASRACSGATVRAT
jgi:hypothetical protein